MSKSLVHARSSAMEMSSRASIRARPSARAPTRARATEARVEQPSKYKLSGPKVRLPEIAERRAAVPYWNDEREKVVLVGDAAREAIARGDARDFIALPCVETSRALRELRQTVSEGWVAHEAAGKGHSSLWPEIFKSAEKLIREEFPSFGESCEILPGTAWLEDDTEAIDWVIRRPEKHIVASKIHFATRLHRDPDSWTNPATTQRPRDGWPELSMPNRERYCYRFINVWLATSALDPTGNAWQSPLVVMLPRDGGRREWMFDKRKLSMTREGAKDENVLSNAFNPLDPKTWVRSGNRLTRGAYSSKKSVEEAAAAAALENEVRGEDGLTDAERAFEFPEVKHQIEQQFVANGALLFDSFDCWHGAARWSEEKSFKKKLTDVDPKGREPFHQARCSIEMRFRVKIDMQNAQTNGMKWGPFTSAVRDGKFLSSPLRDSEAAYDLAAGHVVPERA